MKILYLQLLAALLVPGTLTVSSAQQADSNATSTSGDENTSSSVDETTTTEETTQKRDSNLEHWDNNYTQAASADPVIGIGSDGQLIRYRRKKANGTVYILEEVDVVEIDDEDDGTSAGGGRRWLERLLEDDPLLKPVRMSSGVIPYPSDGAVLVKDDNVIAFKEDTTITNVSAFVFNNDDNSNASFSVKKGIYVEDGVAYVQMGGFSLGEWTWYVTGVTGKNSTPQSFTIVEREVVEEETPEGDVAVNEAEWNFAGQVLTATGRIYFTSMGEDYACTGTAITDNKSGRSIILTAAHCVWDDIDRVWGSNVIFIPNRDSINTTALSTGEEIQRQCSADVCGCWTASAGFVHSGWRDLEWPDNLIYDYGVWVVDDVGSHDGKLCGSEALDEAVEEMEFDVGVDLDNEFIYAMGYSLEHDPDFRYCSDTAMFREPIANTTTYWLDGCGLTGGASGGPWVSKMDEETGKGRIVSVNSWSYTTRSGMGGPIIDEPGARCLINYARNADFDAIEMREDGFEGDFVSCYNRPCIPGEEETSRNLRGGRELCEDKK